MSVFTAARKIIAAGIETRAFPAAVIEVGRGSTVLWRQAFGRLSYDADAPATSDDTIFDLASLSKVISTATAVMRAIEREQISLDDPVSRWLASWRGVDREQVTIRDLLSHSSGLTAYLPFFRDIAGRPEFERAICTMPLEYAPRTRSIYSDLGFILLGFILEDAVGAKLAEQFAPVADLVAPEPLGFNPSREWRGRVAPTEVDPWRGRMLVAEVHDENAWALGGAAGHAGLFGTAGAVGRFVQLVLRTIASDSALARKATLDEFRRRTTVPGSSWALAWDTMLPTSSCGTRMSGDAIGHTGFTGTSLWIDPIADVYIVLLTNRVHPTRDNQQLRLLRPKFHDAVMEGVQ